MKKRLTLNENLFEGIISYRGKNKLSKYLKEDDNLSIQDKFNYLKSYPTYSSRSGVGKAYTRPCKVYDLGLTDEQKEEFFKFLEDGGLEAFWNAHEYDSLNIYQEGRMGGHLILDPQIVDPYVFDEFDSYEEYLQDYLDSNYYPDLETAEGDSEYSSEQIENATSEVNSEISGAYDALVDFDNRVDALIRDLKGTLDLRINDSDIDNLDESLDNSKVVYHGTNEEAAKSILQNGFTKNPVDFSDDEYDAQGYGYYTVKVKNIDTLNLYELNSQEVRKINEIADQVKASKEYDGIKWRYSRNHPYQYEIYNLQKLNTLPRYLDEDQPLNEKKSKQITADDIYQALEKVGYHNIYANSKGNGYYISKRFEKNLQKAKDILDQYGINYNVKPSQDRFYLNMEFTPEQIAESVEGDKIAQDYIDSKNDNFEKDKQATRDMRQELAKQGIATDEQGRPFKEDYDHEYKVFTIKLKDKEGNIYTEEEKIPAYILSTNPDLDLKEYLKAYYNDEILEVTPSGYVKNEALDNNDILDKAYAGSYYTITGAGGNLDEWKNGYQELLNKEGIGTIKEWITFTGADMNNKYQLKGDNAYPADLTFLAFPLDGLNIGKLAIFKLRMEDRWFDDIVDNNKNFNESYSSRLQKLSLNETFKVVDKNGKKVPQGGGFTSKKEAEMFAAQYGEKDLKVVSESFEDEHLGETSKDSFRVNWYTKNIIGRDKTARQLRNTTVEASSADEAIEKVKSENKDIWGYCNAVYLNGNEVRFDDKHTKDYSGGTSIKLEEPSVTESFEDEHLGEVSKKEFTVTAADENGSTYLGRVKAKDNKEAEDKFAKEKEGLGYKILGSHETTPDEIRKGVRLIEDMEMIPETPQTDSAMGIAGVINNLIIDEFEAIDGYNSAIITAEKEGMTDIIDVLKDIVNEENIHVGQLQTCLTKVSPNAQSIDDGQVEAQQQLDNVNQTQVTQEVTEAFDVEKVKKRIARVGEFDNGYVLFNYEPISSAEAEERAKQMSLKYPEDTYYVAYDNVMEPMSSIKWKNGQQVKE